MIHEGWTRWRAAETALANGSDLDTAARDLPPTQAWILRATDALERGDREAFEALIATNPGAEYVALATVALSTPGDHDPTRMRAKLKSLGVPNKPFPCLDLVRLACVAHNGTPPSRPAALAKAVDERVVLRSALMVLSPKFKALQVQGDLAERSPRMARLWAGGVSQMIGPGHVRVCMRKNFPELGELSGEAWPDLEAPIETGSGRRAFYGLDQLLDDPEHVEWNDRCDGEIDEIRHAAEPDVRRKTLGRLLDAIHRLIQSSLPLRAQPLLGPASTLVQSVPHVANKEALMDQLQCLDLRLGWAQHTLPAEALTFLWSGFTGTNGGATPDDRTHAARAILDVTDGWSMPGPVLTSLLASALRVPGDWKQETLPWLRKFGRSISADQLAVALRGAPAPYRLRILGTLQALRGDLPAALSVAAQLLTAGAVNEADGVVELAVAQWSEPIAGRQTRRLFRRAILDYAKAGLVCEPPPAARALCHLLAPVDEDPDRSLFKSLTPVIARRVGVEPEAPYEGFCDHLHLLRTAGQDERIADVFRTFGRWLRRAPTREAIGAALCFCATISQAPTVLASLESGEEDEYRQAADWLNTITQWLDHQPADAVEARALTLATTGDCEPAALILWFDQVSDLPESDGWDRIDALVMDEGIDGRPDLDALAALFGLEGADPF